jgi:hypothetical protein
MAVQALGYVGVRAKALEQWAIEVDEERSAAEKLMR